jgi:hypothetical protein
MAIHVVPETDIKPHVLEGTDCHCEPTVEYLNEETGLPWTGNGPMVIHHCFEMADEKKIGWAAYED